MHDSMLKTEMLPQLSINDICENMW